MRISDWSSDVCSSDLDDRSGRKSIMALMSIAHRCPTGPSRQETPMTTYESAFPTAAFARAVRRAGPRHAALYQYAALNLPAAVLVAVAWQRGWLDTLVTVDSTRLTVVIIAVFGVGMALAAQRLVPLAPQTAS